MKLPATITPPTVHVPRIRNAATTPVITLSLPIVATTTPWYGTSPKNVRGKK